MPKTTDKKLHFQIQTEVLIQHQNPNCCKLLLADVFCLRNCYFFVIFLPLSIDNPIQCNKFDQSLILNLTIYDKNSRKYLVAKFFCLYLQSVPKIRFIIRDEQSNSINNFKKKIMADRQTYIILAKLSLTPNKIQTLSSEYTLLQPKQFYRQF